MVSQAQRAVSAFACVGEILVAEVWCPVVFPSNIRYHRPLPLPQHALASLFFYSPRRPALPCALFFAPHPNRDQSETPALRSASSSSPPPRTLSTPFTDSLSDNVCRQQRRPFVSPEAGLPHHRHTPATHCYTQAIHSNHTLTHPPSETSRPLNHPPRLNSLRPQIAGVTTKCPTSKR